VSRYGKYIREQEAACKCGCGLSALSPQIVDVFTKIRTSIGEPLTITSGSRCKEYNDKVGGKSQSAHTLAVDGYTHALDIAVPHTRLRYLILKYAIENGIRRIGVYPTFIHIDTNPYLPQDVCW